MDAQPDLPVPFCTHAGRTCPGAVQQLRRLGEDPRAVEGGEEHCRQAWGHDADGGAAVADRSGEFDWKNVLCCWFDGSEGQMASTQLTGLYLFSSCSRCLLHSAFH